MSGEKRGFATCPPAEEGSGPWNPGLGPELPRHLLPLSTIFRPENVFNSVEHAHEARDFTGLELQELVVFRPQRLVLHELLIRITSDLSVPAGSLYEELGINFRKMADCIDQGWIAPRMEDIVGEYERMRAELETFIDEELGATIFRPAPAEPERGGLWAGVSRLFGRGEAAVEADDAGPEHEERVRREWGRKACAEGDPMRRAAYRALSRAVSAMHIKHGRMWADRDVLTRLAVGMAANDYCSEAIGRLIEPWIEDAATQLGYVRLPAQARPIVLNTKGASASGKSTLRPMQERLVDRIGERWVDFALISPDIWRKYLLDYASLGQAYMYAGALTGIELEIIDHKLDRYMARKAEGGEMSHLLIDRFRFDSFALDSDQAGSNLLTRFGHLIYIFFMITPPHETVERAWLRGLQFGRFKSVEDLLAHNIEAYSGMPEIFFTWALRTTKSVHYEFLDNSVPKGETPQTVAFGWNGDMNVLDVKGLVDVERYRKINVHAGCPEAVYPPPEQMAVEQNTLFLLQCIRRIPNVNFVHRASGRIYARFEAAKLAWVDAAMLESAFEQPEVREALTAVAPEIVTRPRDDPAAAQQQREALQAARFHTLGRWGE
ncbi:MAG: hypothetical protein H2060_01735 [Azoarcus sp.]|nr:hypothetical protein [Azoarcus sp.]